MPVLGSRVSSNHSFESRPSSWRKTFGCAADVLKPHACSMASRKGIKTSLGSIKIPDPQPVLQQPRPCYPEWGRLKIKLLRQGFYNAVSCVFIEPFSKHLFLPWNPGLWRTGSFFHAVWHESNKKDCFCLVVYRKMLQYTVAGFSLVSSFSFSFFLFNSSTSWITKKFRYLRYERTLFQAIFLRVGETPLHNPYPYILYRWGFLHGDHRCRGTWYQ